MKKGRHRRFEEARALKRSSDIDFDRLLDDLKKDENSEGGELELDDEYDEDDDEVDDEDVRRA